MRDARVLLGRRLRRSSTSTTRRHPTYITDTDFDDPDPLTGLDPPEGNAHQAEYSHDNQFFLAGDEEFAPYRLVSRITEAPYAGLSFGGVAVALPSRSNPGSCSGRHGLRRLRVPRHGARRDGRG